MKAASESKVYLLTTFALLGLLVATIALAYLDLGVLNTAAALSISLIKTGLILWFFMNLRGSGPLIWIAAATGFFWFGIMLVLAMSDFATRGW